MDRRCRFQSHLGTLVLVSGRDHWGERKALIRKGPGVYTHGGLAVTILDHDFIEITSVITEAMSGSPTPGQSFMDEGKSVRLILGDTNCAHDEQAAYPKGTRHFYLVEIRPATNA